MRFKVRHSTVYVFSGMATLDPHRLMMRPQDSHDLRLLSASLTITPAAQVTFHHDVFGNSIGMARFDAPTNRLEIVNKLVLDRFPMPEPLPEGDMPSLYPFTYTVDERLDLGAMLQPDNPEHESQIRTWLSDQLGQMDSGAYDAISLMAALNRAVYQTITYEPREAEGTQTALTTLTSRTGTCRDLAALMIDAARVLGFGARFVTGYLYSPALDTGDTGQMVRGAAATHAWAEIYIPARGWISYDPTNDLIESADLIRVASVRSARQAVPIAGSYRGPSGGASMTVSVEISALPVPPENTGGMSQSMEMHA